MPWLRVDDGFHGHPKVSELSLAAVGLWTLAGSWSAQYLTDGLVKRGQLRRLGAEDEQITELVDSGLWDDNGDGTYQFHDWADYQPVKADVEAEREAARERMKKVRAAKKGLDSDAVQPNVQANAPRTTYERAEEPPENVDRSTGEVRLTPPSPSQPGPSLPIPSISVEPEPESTDEQFDAFWSVFPSERKANKPGCRKKFAQAIKSGIEAQAIIAAAAAYRDDPNREAKFTVAPHRWLNEERWDAAPLPEKNVTGSQARLQDGLRLVQSAANRQHRDQNPFALEIEA
jgi:hypothetical protein